MDGQITTLRSVAGKATVDWTSVCFSNSEPGQSADTQPNQGVGSTNDTGIRLREDFDSQRLIGHIGCLSTKTERVGKLLKKQRGKCLSCGLYFKDGDRLEIDHIIPKQMNGKDASYNWQLLHRHCHDQKTAGEAVAVCPDKH